MLLREAEELKLYCYVSLIKAKLEKQMTDEICTQYEHIDTEPWYFDSGCSKHVTCIKSVVTYSEVVKGRVILVVEKKETS